MVIGAGGHAKVVVDTLQATQRTVIGFLDDSPSLAGKIIYNLPVLGSIRDYNRFSAYDFLIAIGNNQIRRQIADLLAPTVMWANAIHPSAMLSPSVTTGQGVVVMGGVVINADTVIKDHVIVNTAASIDHDCVIDDFVHVAPGVRLAGNVTLKTGVFMGIGSIAIPGRTVGAWATVGAGATVIHDIPANVTAIGTPARW